jgi:hypothetical protein
MKAEQLEITRLRREVSKLKAERDILKKPQPSSRGKRHEVRVHREASFNLAAGMDVQRAGCLPFGLSCLVGSQAEPEAKGVKRSAPRCG